MLELSLAALLSILVALTFDFVNGFHDAANSIATVVSTRVLSPRLAVAWAAFWNFIAFAIFGTAVAATVGTGTIDVGQVTTLDVLLAALVGATLFDLITWYYGLPTSSSARADRRTCWCCPGVQRPRHAGGRRHHQNRAVYRHLAAARPGACRDPHAAGHVGR
jgi:Phosphate transporter family